MEVTCRPISCMEPNVGNLQLEVLKSCSPAVKTNNPGSKIIDDWVPVSHKYGNPSVMWASNLKDEESENTSSFQ